MAQRLAHGAPAGWAARPSSRRPVRTAVAAPQRLPTPTNLDVSHAVDATLDVIESSIEQLKSSYTSVEAQHQPAAPATAHPAAAARVAAPAPAHHSPAAGGDSHRWIGETQPDGSILFRSLDTCCGHMVGQEADGTVLFHFD